MFHYQGVCAVLQSGHPSVCLYGYLKSLMAPEMPSMTVNTLHFTMHSGPYRLYSPAHLKLLSISDLSLPSIAGSAAAPPTAGNPAVQGGYT